MEDCYRLLHFLLTRAKVVAGHVPPKFPHKKIST